MDNLAKIAETGLLGVLLVVALGVIAFLYREIKEEKNNRLNDIKEMYGTDKAFIGEVKVTLQTILSLIKGNK